MSSPGSADPGALQACCAEQLFKDVEYVGPRGACPMCHLSVGALPDVGLVECPTCGAGGELRIVDGPPVVMLGGEAA